MQLISSYRISSRRRCRRSRGYLYIAVLFTTLIVIASVTAALSISTSSLRGQRDHGNQGEALRLAETELHRQAASMQSGAWRSQFTSGVFSAWRGLTIDGETLADDIQIRHRLVDVDGDLANNLGDSVELTVHARVGSSEAAIAVELESAPEPLGLLAYSVTATDSMQFETGTLSCERPVQVLNDCDTSTWGVLTTPQLEIGGTVTATLRGDQAAGSSITTPQQSVVDWLKSQGTQLVVPSVASEMLIQDIVLSPTSNPYGSADSLGVYWINAGGAKVVISHCRLDATLAIENASVVEITGGVVWNFPAAADVILASDSPIDLVNVEATLDENSRGVNFNPSISPYRGTLANNTSTDIYTTELRGVLYSTDDFRMYPMVGSEVLQMTGAIICDQMRVEGYMTIRQLDELLENPPEALDDPTPMEFVRGTFRRVPSP